MTVSSCNCKPRGSSEGYAEIRAKCHSGSPHKTHHHRFCTHHKCSISNERRGRGGERRERERKGGERREGEARGKGEERRGVMEGNPSLHQEFTVLSNLG